MITELHTVALYVADQDRAKRFYVDTLGFDLNADQPGLGGIGRWIEGAGRRRSCSRTPPAGTSRTGSACPPT